MTWGAVAATTIGVVGGGIATSRASSKAAKSAEKGAERSAAQVQASADQARGDALSFFPSAQQDLLAGAGAAGDILTQGVTEQQRLLSSGNLNAQQTLGQGFQNVQAGILGTPQQSFAPQPVQGQPTQAQQPFAPRAIEVSQPIQNPLIPQEDQPGLFSDVGRVLPDEAKGKLADISSNSDIFRLIQSGEIDIPGLDTNWLAQLEAAERARPNSSILRTNSLLDAADEGNFDRFGAGGLNDRNKATMRLLISGLAKIRGA